MSPAECSRIAERVGAALPVRDRQRLDAGFIAIRARQQRGEIDEVQALAELDGLARRVFDESKDGEQPA